MFPGYPDLIGRKQAFVASGFGPTSSSQTVGDPLTLPGYETYIDCILEVPLDPTGTYFAQSQASFVGPRATWALFYYTAAGSKVTNGTNLSTYQFIVTGYSTGT